eukprot:1195060-Prorocentrum_minimum.AAC.7
MNISEYIEYIASPTGARHLDIILKFLLLDEGEGDQDDVEMSSSLWGSRCTRCTRRCRACCGTRCTRRCRDVELAVVLDVACVAHARGWRAVNTSIDGHSLQATRCAPRSVDLLRCRCRRAALGGKLGHDVLLGVLISCGVGTGELRVYELG